MWREAPLMSATQEVKRGNQTETSPKRAGENYEMDPSRTELPALQQRQGNESEVIFVC